MVIRLSAIQYGAIWGYQRQFNNEVARFAAYRQFIMWRYGRLGQRNLKVIPSCSVSAIRDRFPDPNVRYVDFSLGGGQQT